MSIFTLRTTMLIALYLSLIFIILVAFDEPLHELVSTEPGSKPLVIVGAVITIIISAAGIHGVYSEKRGFLVPFIFYNCLVTSISLSMVGDLWFRKSQGKYIARCLTSTVTAFTFALISYFYYHEVERRREKCLPTYT